MKKTVAAALAAMLSAAMIFTGCSDASSKEAVQTLTDAAAKMEEIQSANQVSTLDIQLVQEGAPQVDFFNKKITAQYTDGGANGTVELEGEQLRQAQNISVLFKDGVMYQNVDGMRYVSMPDEPVTAGSADMLQMYKHKLPAKLAELGEKMDNLSQKEENGAVIITGEVSGEAAAELGRYFFLDFLVGDEEMLEQNRADMMERLKAQRDSLPEEEKAQYTDEVLEKMVQEQMDAYTQHYDSIFAAIALESVQYEGRLENGFLTSQKVTAQASYQEMNYSLEFTDTLTDVDTLSQVELPELTEENTMTIQEYQEEMMMMQMFMQQIQQAAGQS